MSKNKTEAYERALKNNTLDLHYASLDYRKGKISKQEFLKIKNKVRQRKGGI